MRAKLKSLMASFMHDTGLLRALRGGKRVHGPGGDAVILVYHRIVEDFESEAQHTQPGMMVSQETFDRQLEFLCENYTVISLRDFIDILKSGRRPEPGSVVLTFDDGWRDNYTLAYPILKKHQVPAAVFLTTDYIGTDRTFWFHQIGLALSAGTIPGEDLYGTIADISRREGEQAPVALSAGLSSRPVNLDTILERVKTLKGTTPEKIADALTDLVPAEARKYDGRRWMLNWDEVNAMAGDLVEIGSHGCAHRIMTGLADDDLQYQLQESRRVIEEHTGHLPGVLAYPNGNFDVSVVEAAIEAGYHAAVTTAFEVRNAGINKWYALKRVGIHEGMSVDPDGRFSESMFALGISGWKSGWKANV